MKVLVAGSRSITDPAIVERAIRESGFHVTTLISGMARGVDRLAEKWAVRQGIPVDRHFANWTTNGRAAGMIRNKRMVDVADAAVVIWDGVSKGTAHTFKLAQEKRIPVFHQIVGGTSILITQSAYK